MGVLPLLGQHILGTIDAILAPFQLFCISLVIFSQRNHENLISEYLLNSHAGSLLIDLVICYFTDVGDRVPKEVRIGMPPFLVLEV